MSFHSFTVVSPMSNVKPEKVRINVDAVNYVAVSRTEQVGESIIHMAGKGQHALAESVATVASALSEKMEGSRLHTSGNLTAQERRVHVNLKQVREIYDHEGHVFFVFLDGSDIRLES